jgi:benzodiazapine receptor
MPSRARAAIALLVALALCLGVGGLGAAATAPAIDGWYRTLQRPSWTPPDWVFGPVWTTLYALMALAAWLVWTSARPGTARLPLAVFGVQLALNAGWSWLFFGAQQPGLAAAEIVVLLVAVVASAALFFRVRPLAGWLMVPYAGWVGFASALNIAFWWLNT